MKIFKSLIVLLLVLSLLPIMPAFADEAVTEIASTETEAFKKLSAFGIISENDEILKSKTVSRRLFTYYAIKCCFGDSLYSENVSLPFTDVSMTDVGAKEIAAAYQMGIIGGKTANTFCPDDNITMNEAAKILVTILGYGTVAANEGGYPIGYMTYANSFKLFRGCAGTSSSAIPTEDFLKMLVNMLETDVMTAEAIKIINNSYSVSSYVAKEGKTLLETNFSIRKAEGLVESNEYSSVNGLSSLPENVVTINSVNYAVNGTKADDLLGYKVEFYYKVDNVKAYNDIVYIAPYFDVNVTVVENDSIARDAVTERNFVYFKTNTAKKAENIAISRSAVMFLNGGQKRISALDLCPENGTVTLIDNNNDKVIDVIKVMNYRTIQVSSISSSTYTLSDGLGGTSVVLDPTDTDYKAVIYKDGKLADFSSIAVDDIISYAASTGCNKNIKYVVVSSKKVEGILNIISDDYIEIDNTVYPIDANVSDDLKLGTSGVYFLDFNGRVVALRVTREYVYGYLNGIEEGNFGLVRVRIFTENNRWGTLELNENITFNGVRTPVATVYRTLMSGDFHQLIRYAVDANGKVCMIELSNSVTPYSSAEESAIDGDDFRAYPRVASARYRTSINGFGNDFRIDDNTKVFLIPEGNAPEEDFYVPQEDYFLSNELYYNVTAYDVDRSKLAKAVVLEGHDVRSVIADDTAFLIIDSVVKTLNAEGEVVDSIKGYYNGTKITLTAKDNDVFETLSEPLSEGDAVQFSLDVDGYIKSIAQRYNRSLGENQQFITNNLYATATFLGGVSHYTDALQRVIIADATQKVLLMTKPSTEIWVYDTVTKTVTLGSLADLENGDEFITRLHYYVAEEIVIYR